LQEGSNLPSQPHEGRHSPLEYPLDSRRGNECSTSIHALRVPDLATISCYDVEAIFCFDETLSKFLENSEACWHTLIHSPQDQQLGIELTMKPGYLEVDLFFIRDYLVALVIDFSIVTDD